MICRRNMVRRNASQQPRAAISHEDVPFSPRKCENRFCIHTYDCFFISA